MGVRIGVVGHLADRPLLLDQFGTRGGAFADVEEGRDRAGRLSAPTSLSVVSRVGPVVERQRVVALRRRCT